MMNNSQIIIEPKDTDELLRIQEARIIRIIEAIQGIQKMKEWQVLKEEIFDGLTHSLEKEIKNEARSENPNVLKLTRLSGKIEWAEKYADLSKLENNYRSQLVNIKLKLYGEQA